MRVGEHLCVLLLVLAQHLRHGHQRLDLGHLLADVAQLGQVALAHVVHCGQVAGGVTLAEKRLICAEKKYHDELIEIMQSVFDLYNIM